MKKLSSAFVALVMLASACGGSDDDSAEISQIDADVETTLAGEVATTEATETTTAEVEDVAADGDIDLYCAFWATSEAEGDGFFESPESDIPANVEQYIVDQTGYLDQGIEAAPDEIKADLELQRDGIVRVGEILENNDWSLAASIAELATDPLVNSPEADEASDRLDAFNEANCQAFAPAEEASGDPSDDKSAVDGADDGAATDPATEVDDVPEPTEEDLALEEAELLEGLLQTDAGREAFIEQLTAGSDVTAEQAGCLVDNLNADMLVAMNDLDDIDSPGAQAFLQLLETCDIPLEAFL